MMFLFIKEYRLKQIEKLVEEHPKSTWKFVKGSIADKALVDSLFEEYKPNVVVNLAAQAGVPLFYYQSGCIYPVESDWFLQYS